MKTPRLPSLAVICGTAISLMAAYPACATGGDDPPPARNEAASPRQAEISAEQPASMPTDEFGHELNYCQLPWDYLPGENQADVLPQNSAHMHLFTK
jgi:hypothetical protein